METRLLAEDIKPSRSCLEALESKPAAFSEAGEELLLELE